MSIASKADTRDERKKQLLRTWKSKEGQLAVLSLCHRALPPGETLSAGMSVIDVILDHEFGPEPKSQPSSGGESSQATDAPVPSEPEA